MNNILLLDPSHINAWPAAVSTKPAGQVPPYQDTGKAVAVIQVYGPLSHRARGGLMGMLFSETATYDQIRQNFRAAVADESVGSILMDIDSPGGEVAGVFDLADEIYAARGSKPIYAIANEAALSAAYIISSATDRIYLTRTASVGSIGVVALHVDQSGLNEKAGLRYDFIYAGSKKIDGNAHTQLSESARKDIQERVDSTYDLFVSTVARNRGLTEAAVRSTEAAVRSTEAAIFTGEKAVSAGLADGILFYNDLLQQILKGEPMALKTDLRTLLAGKKPEDIAEAMQACGYIPADQAKNDDSSKVKEILGLCELAGVTDMAFVNQVVGMDVKAAREQIMQAKADTSKTHIFSAVSATGTGEVNPLLADAKRRAGEK